MNFYLIAAIILLLVAILAWLLVTKKPVKYIKRVWTGMHRIQRLAMAGDIQGLYHEMRNSRRIDARRSRLAELLQSEDGPEAYMQAVAEKKHLVRQQHPSYQRLKGMFVEIARKICVTEQLDERRRQAVGKSKEDEERIRRLWELYLSGFEFKRQTTEWQKMGFQGDDPCTDFRGAGSLALDWLLYFGETHHEAAEKCLNTANAPENYFFFAVTAIHATIWTLEILKGGRLDAFLIETEDEKVPEELFCELLCRFTRYWAARKRNIMEYNGFVEDFKSEQGANTLDLTRTVSERLEALKKRE